MPQALSLLTLPQNKQLPGVTQVNQERSYQFLISGYDISIQAYKSFINCSTNTTAFLLLVFCPPPSRHCVGCTKPSSPPSTRALWANHLRTSQASKTKPSFPNKWLAKVTGDLLCSCWHVTFCLGFYLELWVIPGELRDLKQWSLFSVSHHVFVFFFFFLGQHTTIKWFLVQSGSLG
jgi:hypothetical protein